jgi:hypothetical protein
MGRGRRTIAAWGERFRRSVRERYLVRLHMLLILAAVYATGLITTRVLFGVGVMSMPCCCSRCCSGWASTWCGRRR